MAAINCRVLINGIHRERGPSGFCVGPQLLDVLNFFAWAALIMSLSFFAKVGVHISSSKRRVFNIRPSYLRHAVEKIGCICHGTIFGFRGCWRCSM